MSSPHPPRNVAIPRTPRAVLSLLAAAALLSGAPTAAAAIENPESSTPTTLYFHVFDPFTPFPVNTQPMNASFFEVGGTSFPTMASQGYKFNTIYGFSTSGPVEYEFIENGRPRFHPEHGIAKDVLLDASVQPVVFLYVDARDALGIGALPTALPSFHFRVTMREGDDVRGGDLDAGALLMHGAASAHVVDARVCPEELIGTGAPCSDGNAPFAGQTGPDGLPVLIPDVDGVVEFRIPMTVEKPVIPKTEAYNVRIDWWQSPGGAIPEGELASGFMRLVADPDHLPRLEMSVLNPVYVEFLHPQVAAGTLMIHAGVNSPWGTYDVRAENVTVRIEGPSTPTRLERVVTQNSHVHHLHDQAAEITWLWRFREDQAKEGEYRILLSVSNLAGNAVARADAAFKIEGKKAYGLDTEGKAVVPLAVEDTRNESPGAGVGALAAAAVAAALASRRRERR